MSRGRARSAAGARVGGGRLRVDAARAVNKLRDYQLADPAMWALEAVRAAAASGATAVHVDGDADDVWVGWEGDPLAAGELPRLLDELVSPAGSDERRPLRLLAVAINTALGLGPRHVDVYAIDGGETLRARYAPQLLATTAATGAAEGLRQLTATAAAIPTGAPAIARGVLVHMRRFPALEALSLLATGQEPRELRIARRACEDFPRPLRLGHGPLAAHHAAGDLLRVRIDPAALGGEREAFVAITELARLEPYVDYAELGVVLATQPIDVGLAAAPGARVPIRARIDAPRLPTNASRSAVRRDEPWCRRAEEMIAKAIPDLVARLVRELGEEAEAEWPPKALARLRAAALTLAAAPIAGPDWREALLGGRAPAVLAPLYDATIARDALGRARSIRNLARAGHALVHRGAAPLDEELAPWLGDVPWVPPGDPLGRLWGGASPPGADALVAQARTSRAARAKWLERAVAEPVLAPDPAHVVIVPLEEPGRSARSCIPATLLDTPGLRGELAILGAGAPRAEIRLLVDGRETDVSRRESTVPIVAIATAPALRLVAAHDAVADDDAKRDVLLACGAAAVIACEAVARQLVGRRAPNGETARFAREPDPETAAAIVRAGAQLAIQVLGRADGRGAAALAGSRSPLLDAPAWPTTSGAMASLGALLLGARGRSAIGVVPRAPAAPFELAGRTIVIADAHERAALEALVGEASLVDYGDRLDPPPSAEALARSIRGDCVATLAFERGSARGALGWARGEPGWVRLSHLGRTLATLDPPQTALRARLALDDDRLVPGRGWEGARVPPEHETSALARELEAELIAALIDAMIGRARADLHAPPMAPVPPSALVERVLHAVSSTSSELRARIGRERVAALAEVPLFRRTFATEPVSYAAARASLGGELVYVGPALAASSGPRLADFDPVVLDPTGAAGVGALFGQAPRRGDDELARRWARARRDERLRALRSEPARPLALPGCHPVVRVTGQGLDGLLGVTRRWGADRTDVAVRIEGRPLCGAHEPLPCLEAVVDGDPTLADEEMRGLSDAGASRVRGAIRDATARLVIELASTLDRPLVQDEAALRLVAAWCASAPDRTRGSAKKVLAALRAAPIFVTVQGGRASIDDATPRTQVRVSEPVDGWVGPAPDEKPTPFDEPVLVCSPEDDDPVRAILKSVTSSSLRNVTVDVRRLLAARRVAQGLVERPRLASVADTRFRWTLEELAEHAVGDERASFEGLGIGELALTRGGPTALHAFENGAQLARIELDLRPYVAIACEPPWLRGGRVSPKDQGRLDGLARVVVARALRHMVESTKSADLPSWVRHSLRGSALVGGAAHLEAIADTEIFETSTGAWLSPRAVKEQAERFGEVWWTSMPVGASPLPLDPERVVLRLEPSEASQLGVWAKSRRADEELRLDALARANRDRPPLASIGPTYHELGLGLARASIEGAGRAGTVLALHPAHVGARGLRAHRHMRPLGSVPDGAPWPTLAWIDDPALSPDRTWSSPVDDGALARAREAVSQGCEAALAEAFPAPAACLAHVRVDRRLSEISVQARGVQARGVLAIPIGDEPSVDAIDATGERALEVTIPVAHHRAPRPLPLIGRVALAGVAGPAAGAALAAVGRAAYARMLRVIGARLGSGSSADRDLDLAELVRAATLGCLEPGDPARSLALAFLVGPDPSLGALADALARGDEILIVPPERRDDAWSLAGALGAVGPVVVDDGTLAARRAIAGAPRAVPLARKVSERVLEDAPLPDAPVAATPAPPHAVARPTGREKRVAPAPAAPIAPSPTLVLPERVEAKIAATGASTSRIPIAIDLLAGAPLASLLPGGSVELALRHPCVRALERQADDEAVALLAAHVVGVAARGSDDAAELELRAIAALLAG